MTAKRSNNQKGSGLLSVKQDQLTMYEFITQTQPPEDTKRYYMGCLELGVNMVGKKGKK